LKIIATRLDAYKLFHEGSIAFADIEDTGMRLDTFYCECELGRLGKQIDKLRAKVKKSKIMKRWTKIKGNKFNPDSNEQLADILFNHMGYKAKVFTAKTNKPSAKEEALAQIDDSTVKRIIRIKQLDRVRKKLYGMYRESVDGIMHPFLELHTVKSYRSSGSWPNPHNFDKRRKDMAKIIRRAIIAHKPSDQLVELDYGRLEVHAATWYHQDPNMMAELADPKRDIHRDLAKRLFKLKAKEMGKKGSDTYKDIRWGAKNKFVFREQYGGGYEAAAKDLWEYAGEGLVTADGTPMLDHLANKRIESLDEYEPHVESVEDWYWNEKFEKYGRWREDWYRDYLRKGYTKCLSGFRFTGFMTRNECINYPSQGVAFHCTLWSLIQLNKYFKKHKMKSRIIGQIHDSIIINVAMGELDDVLAIAQKTMCVSIKKHWPWIITQLEVEAEVAGPGESWWKAKGVELVA